MIFFIHYLYDSVIVWIQNQGERVAKSGRIGPFSSVQPHWGQLKAVIYDISFVGHGDPIYEPPIASIDPLFAIPFELVTITTSSKWIDEIWITYSRNTESTCVLIINVISCVDEIKFVDIPWFSSKILIWLWRHQ